MKRLNDLHRLAIQLILDGDLTMDQIAERVKKSRQTLYNWINDPVFAKELEERKSQLDSLYKARLTQNAGRALDRAKKILLDSEDDRAAASVIADTLDRAGYPRLKTSDLKKSENNAKSGVVILPDFDLLSDEDEEDTDGLV